METKNEKILSVAVKDNLTNIFNRHGFKAEWEKFLSGRSREVDKKPFTVAVFDLDGFKAINEEYGHSGGDFALESVARAIENVIRMGDILCRLGGDEFGIVFPDTDEVSGQEAVRRVLRAITEEASQKIKEKYPGSKGVSASIGMITTGPASTHGVPDDQLFHVADEIAGTVKKAGKGDILDWKTYREIVA